MNKPTPVRSIEEVQRIAIENPVTLICETLRPKYRTNRGDHVLTLTVNRGHTCIDLELGGPVWQATTRSLLAPTRIQRPHLLKAAIAALNGIGNRDLGQWRNAQWETGGGLTVHVHRRLTPMEENHVRTFLDRGSELLVDRRGTPGHTAIARTVAQETGFEPATVYAIDTRPPTEHPDPRTPHDNPAI